MVKASRQEIWIKRVERYKTLIAVDVKILKKKRKSIFLNLPPSPLDCFENIVPNFFPTRCFVFFELALLVAFSNFSDKGVEHIVHMPPGKKVVKSDDLVMDTYGLHWFHKRSSWTCEPVRAPPPSPPVFAFARDQPSNIFGQLFFFITMTIELTLFATSMTGTSSDARTFAIRFLYSTASLKLCLQHQQISSWCWWEYCKTQISKWPMRILQNTNIKVINDIMIRQPVSDAVADDKTLPTAHILLTHCSKFNL